MPSPESANAPGSTELALDGDRLSSASDAILKDNAQVLMFFRRVSKAPMDEIRDPTRREAAQLVLAGYDEGILSIDQLRAVLKHPVQFVSLYRCISIGKDRRSSAVRYLALMSVLSRFVLGTLKIPKHATLHILGGHSPEYWLQGGLFGGGVSNVSYALADDYRKQLARHRPFRLGWAQLTARIRKHGWTGWHYEFRSNYLWKCSHHAKLSQLTLRTDADKAERESMKAFCERWCLGEIGLYQPHPTTGKTKCIIKPLHVLVSTKTMGIDVFIPRYLRFTHIHNYDDADFAPLKHAMDKAFASDFRMGGTEDLAALIKRAKEHRKVFRQQGMSRAEAWEKTRTIMGWKYSTMKKWLGDQPHSGKNYTKSTSGKTDHALRRTKDAVMWDFLRTYDLAVGKGMSPSAAAEHARKLHRLSKQAAARFVRDL